MKYRCFAALALAMLLPGCAAAPDLTPVWQRDLPASGVHIELANAALLSDADVYYAATREELYVHNVGFARRQGRRSARCNILRRCSAGY